ncbi:MAG: DNA replication/repair protein RecF [Clostridiales bacterium]|nr:DNA replication/repair protein RecF [Clostridiales bacterium]
MKIESIEIENFRNIEKMSAEFDGTNIIYGENAQGKTNLIEAIYLFCGSKSFRKTKDKELIMFGKDYARLKIEFEGKERRQNAQIIIKERRAAELNGIKKQFATALSQDIKVIIFSPDHLTMVKNGPAERRKFIDAALCQIKSGYRNVLKEYNRSLVQRNILLKDVSKNTAGREMLDVWNKNLAGAGAKIIYQRNKYVQSLLPYASEIFSGISNNKEKISLTLNNSFECDFNDIGDIRKQFLKQLENDVHKDIITQRTNAGPHRDDVDIYINGSLARQFASQGQQRSCVLALKLAEAGLLSQMTGESPIALLDDVMSELDEKRQEYIINNINAGQIFITCCDAAPVLKLKEGRAFQIKGGKIV